VPRERELKLAIPHETDFRLLLERLGKPQEIREQVNHYYDTPRFELLRRHMCIRLREEQGKRILALKRGRGWRHGYLDADEAETEIPPQPIDPATFDPLSLDLLPVRILKRDLPPGPLNWIGSIRNTRRVYRLRPGLTLELDATLFPGDRTDFELEVESDDEENVRREVVGLLEEWGVRWAPQTATKHQRLLSILGLP